MSSFMRLIIESLSLPAEFDYSTVRLKRASTLSNKVIAIVEKEGFIGGF